MTASTSCRLATTPHCLTRTAAAGTAAPRLPPPLVAPERIAPGTAYTTAHTEDTMVPLTSLWLPILLSAVIVFVASSIIHMLLPYHRKDYRPVPAEDGVMEALRRFSIPPGDYFVPCPTGPSAMKDPAFLEKRNKGPILVMTVMPGGPIAMGPTFVQWFVYCVVVGVF